MEIKIIKHLNNCNWKKEKKKKERKRKNYKETPPPISNLLFSQITYIIITYFGSPHNNAFPLYNLHGMKTWTTILVLSTLLSVLKSTNMPYISWTLEIQNSYKSWNRNHANISSRNRGSDQTSQTVSGGKLWPGTKFWCYPNNNSVLSEFSFNLLADIQLLTSLTHSSNLEIVTSSGALESKEKSLNHERRGETSFHVSE